MSDSQYVYGQYPIPSDPRVILAALDRRMAQGIGGHSRAARMQEHRARLVEQIAAMDSAPVQASNEADSAIVPGTVFDTPFESGCVALTAPDDLGCFDGLDSDGVKCAFTDPSVVIGAMPLTITGQTS